MKPFDLEAAKRGEKVITRSGKQARIICFDANLDTEEAYKLVALVQHLATKTEILRTFTVKGELNSNKESDYDLFMEPETVTLHVVTWLFRNVRIKEEFESADEANYRAKCLRGGEDVANVKVHAVVLEV